MTFESLCHEKKADIKENSERGRNRFPYPSYSFTSVEAPEIKGEVSHTVLLHPSIRGLMRPHKLVPGKTVRRGAQWIHRTRSKSDIVVTVWCGCTVIDHWYATPDDFYQLEPRISSWWNQSIISFQEKESPVNLQRALWKLLLLGFRKYSSHVFYFVC